MIINILQESYSLFFDKMFVVLTVLQIYKKVAELAPSISCESHKQKKKVQDHIVLNLIKVSRIRSLYARLSIIVCTDIS